MLHQNSVQPHKHWGKPCLYQSNSTYFRHYEFNLNAVKNFFHEEGITLTTIGNKTTFEDSLSYKVRDKNPILLVATASEHNQEQFMKGQPTSSKYTILMTLIQKEPHLLLPFLHTNQTIWLGRQIRNRVFGCLENFDGYMKVNLNPTISPSQNGSPNSVMHILHFYKKFTIALALSTDNP